MIVKDLQPFSIVEDAVFQGMMKHIVPQYNIPSRRYFVDNEIGELYHDTRAKLVSSISSVKQLSLTPNIWSPRINDGYIGVTAHYISSIRTKTADHGVKSLKRDMLASLEKRYENLYTCPHYVSSAGLVISNHRSRLKLISFISLKNSAFCLKTS